MEFRFYEIWREAEYVERLITGTGWSLLLTIAAAVMGFCLAIGLATGRRSENRLYSTLCACYVELIRNTPLIVQLFFVVFGLPMLLGYRWPFPASALLALTLNFSAYYSEIIRTGLDNVDKGQIEAALVLSIPAPQRFTRIVLPQALAKVYPSLVSQFVFLFLTTGIISEIGIEELTWSGRFIADRTFRDFEIYLVLTVLYVLLAIGFKGIFYIAGRHLFPLAHCAMKSLLQSLFGDFHGNIVYVLLEATQWTIYLSLAAFIGGGLIGLLITLLRISPVKHLRYLATAYIWLFQAIPLLMLLFLTGLGIPVFFKVDVPPWLAATLSLTLFTSAYLAEVWRGAIHSIVDGQWEAGIALGLRFWQTVRLVIAPQAVTVSLAPTVGFMVQIIKGTSLAYIIDFSDVMRWGKKIANAQLDGAEPFVVYPIVAAIYFSLCFPLTVLSRRLERRTSKYGYSSTSQPVNQGA